MEMQSKVEEKVNFLERYGRFLLCLLFGGAIFFALRAFPILNRDEYHTTLFKGQLLKHEWHALGYYLQFEIWRFLGESDLCLRLFSVIWASAAVFFCWQWGRALKFSTTFIWHWCALLATNAFFLEYAVQVRFYSFFIATSLLMFWRLTAWSEKPTQGNLWRLILSGMLVCTAHLFGLVVVAIAIGVIVWPHLGRWKGFWVGFFLLLAFSLMVPTIRQSFVNYVYWFTGIGQGVKAISRGLKVIHLLKLFFAFFQFTLGTNFYPFLWGITIPAGIVVGISFSTEFES